MPRWITEGPSAPLSVPLHDKLREGGGEGRRERGGGLEMGGLLKLLSLFSRRSFSNATPIHSDHARPTSFNLQQTPATAKLNREK